MVSGSVQKTTAPSSVSGKRTFPYTGFGPPPCFVLAAPFEDFVFAFFVAMLFPPVLMCVARRQRVLSRMLTVT
jgi:hypothetical protein